MCNSWINRQEKVEGCGTGGKRSDERKRRSEESCGWHVTEHSDEEKFSECGPLNVIRVSYDSKVSTDQTLVFVLLPTLTKVPLIWW